jgi:hypothetical protein
MAGCILVRFTLQRNGRDTGKQCSRQPRPNANTAHHQRLRAAGERCGGARRRALRWPRWRIRRRRRACQVLHGYVVCRKRLSQSRVFQKLARVESDSVLRQVCVLRWHREVGRLREDDESISVGHVSYRRRWLQVWHHSHGNVERGQARRVAAPKRHVGRHPVEQLNTGAIARNIQVDHQKNSAVGAICFRRPYGRADAGWLRRICNLC